MIAADVFKRARFHLNDTANYYYTDAVLLEPLNVAIDDLRGELYDNNIPITNAVNDAIIAVEAGIREISRNTIPSLPLNMVEIQELHERQFGTSGQFSQIKRVEYLPLGITPTSSIIFWAWQEEIVKLNPSNTKTEIKFSYIKDAISPVIGPASFIDMIRSLPFLSYRTAALAAENLGEDTERAASLNSNAQRELDKLVNLSVKGKQVMPVRRRPFQENYNSGAR